MSHPTNRAYYDEMIALYDQFVQGNLKQHYTTYFDRLKLYFKKGILITRIHALELILNIILGGKWTGAGSRPQPPEELSHMGLVQYRLQQIEKQWKSQQSSFDNGSDEGTGEQIPVEEMISWLFEVLPQETEADVLKVYFIFIKTHWEQLRLEEHLHFERLYKLHHQLLENKKYAKLEVLERLHQDAFSSGYRPLR